MTRVELVIDELVLHGVSPLERHAISDAIEVELRRLLATGRSWHSVGEANVESVTVRDVRVSGSRDLALGTAAAIHHAALGTHRSALGMNGATLGAHRSSPGAHLQAPATHHPANGAHSSAASAKR